MREYLTLGSCPSDESCAQVGSPNYSKQMRMETRALINQLERIHPVPDDQCPRFSDASFTPFYSVKSFQHDFGSYHEVCAMYDPEHEPSCQWALKAEELFPESWDSDAKNELTSMGYEFPEEYYCESCHNMKHGKDNCPYRLAIGSAAANHPGDEKQSLLPGEFLKLTAPIGGIVEIEHTADTYSISIEDTVLFSAEMYNGEWLITHPQHLSTLPELTDEQLETLAEHSRVDFKNQELPEDF